MPLFCFWIFGSVNLFVGYLLRPQQCGGQPAAIALKKGGGGAAAARPNILPESMDGMGSFLFSYCVPSTLLMVAVFYEFANRDLWLNVPQPSSEPVSAVKAPMSPFMVRAFMELLLGVIASAWALGPRAINFWRSKAPGPGNKNPNQMQMLKPMQNYSHVNPSGHGSVSGSQMVQYNFGHPQMQHHQQQQHQLGSQHGHPMSLNQHHHLQHPQQQMMAGGMNPGNSHYGMNKFVPSSYPAVSYQTVCQAPSSYLSATGSMPRHYSHRKYHGGGQQQQYPQLMHSQQQRDHHNQQQHHGGGSRKSRNSNYKMTLSQSISLTGNETILWCHDSIREEIGCFRDRRRKREKGSPPPRSESESNFYVSVMWCDMIWYDML